MHVLIGLGLGLTLLYFWLIGHWFARVLMVPICAIPTCLFVCWIVASSSTGDINPGIKVMTWLAGFALAWPVSSIPIYWLRFQERRRNEEIALALYNLNPGRLIPREALAPPDGFGAQCGASYAAGQTGNAHRTLDQNGGRRATIFAGIWICCVALGAIILAATGR